MTICTHLSNDQKRELKDYIIKRYKGYHPRYPHSLHEYSDHHHVDHYMDTFEGSVPYTVIAFGKEAFQQFVLDAKAGKASKSEISPEVGILLGAGLILGSVYLAKPLLLATIIASLPKLIIGSGVAITATYTISEFMKRK
jgi:hypothetical protein